MASDIPALFRQCPIIDFEELIIGLSPKIVPIADNSVLSPNGVLVP